MNYIKIAGLSLALATATFANPEGSAESLTIVGVGDIMMGLNYPDNKPVLPKQDGDLIFSEVADVLKDADLTTGNLEGVLLDKGGQPKPCCRDFEKKSAHCYCFRMPERYTKHLINAGFDYVSVSNNHSGDFGAEGRTCTQKALDEAKLAYAGFEKSCEYKILELNGVRYGFAAFSVSSGTLTVFNTEKAKQTISMLRDSADIVIVSMHVGAEGVKYTHITREMEEFLGDKRGNPYQFARTAIDAGADIVFGHGPHVPRAIDLYKGKFIAYSLGNFATSTSVNIQGVTGYAPIVKVTIDKKTGDFKEGQIYSFIQKGNNGDRKPTKDEKGACIKLIKELTEADIPESPLKIAEDGKITLK
jgi:poly-gamma-glutamate capsule biosynthesis protein CapA/YwtB (metallophosphatase superfamily)